MQGHTPALQYWYITLISVPNQSVIPVCYSVCWLLEIPKNQNRTTSRADASLTVNFVASSLLHQWSDLLESHSVCGNAPLPDMMPRWRQLAISGFHTHVPYVFIQSKCGTQTLHLGHPNLGHITYTVTSINTITIYRPVRLRAHLICKTCTHQVCCA